jgi:predicted nucleic acid-binding protein
MFARLCASASGSVVRADALIDTGAIVALLNQEDRWHGVCTQAFETLRLPMLTSEAVLTEVFHFAGNHRRGMESAWTFIRSGALKLAEIQDSELPQIHALMSRYWDRPMDFADATLVYLAKRESLLTIFTVDHSDFETYRIEGHRRFRVLPTARPSLR